MLRIADSGCICWFIIACDGRLFHSTNVQFYGIEQPKISTDAASSDFRGFADLPDRRRSRSAP